MNSINTKFERISLQDSFVKNINRKNSLLSIEFDWSYLNDYEEAGVDKAIITGKSFFKSSSVIKEKFRQTGERDEMFEISKPNDFEKYFGLIGSTDFGIDGQIKMLSIGGFFENKEITRFIQWDIYFEAAEYEWENFVLLSEWQQGKIPK